MEQKIFQITSGKGPEECERAVAKVVEKLMKDARSNKLEATLINSVNGNIKGTMLSAMLLIKGEDVKSFSKLWEGTIQWVSQSPYRKLHRRKNWFVGVITHDVTKQRSQLMNKKEAIERLKNKIIGWQVEKENEKIQEQWMEHNLLLRGNPIKTFKEPLN